MPTIDAQVHAYERDHAARPWVATLAGPPEVTGDDMVTAMDAVGVDGAILVSPWTLYRYDESYALSVQAAYPGRFGLVKPIDPSDPAVAETIENWAGRPGTVAIRIMLSQTASTDGNDPGIDNVLCAAARHELLVNLSYKGRLEQVRQLASRNVETQLVVDHLGLEQPHHPPVPQNPFGGLSKLLNLAQYDNIAVKVTGVCTLSHSLFPYDDLWDPLARVFDAFGLDRCMWGTDWTRAMEIINYAQGVEPFRLTDRLSSDERETLMGGTLQRIYDWSPRPNQ